MKRIGIALALFVLARASLGAQDHAHESQSLEDVHARMLELMGKVETRLKSIDDLLNDASARAKGLAPASDASAIDKVLVVSRDSARQNLDDIDEILRLSLHPHPGGVGGGA
jgi:hypothetical protein